MTRKLFVQTAALFACGALAAGCGGAAKPAASTTSGAASSASTTTSSSTTTPSSTTTTASSAAKTTSGVASSASTTTGDTTHSPTPATPSAGLSAEVAVCKREVASAGANALTAAERSQLGEVCTLAGSRNRARLRAAERQVCLTVIRDTAPGLSGAAVTAAQESCNRF